MVSHLIRCIAITYWIFKSLQQFKCLETYWRHHVYIYIYIYIYITLTSITPKIYNALLLNHIAPEIEKILRKKQNGSRFTTSQILTIRWISEGSRAKNLEATLLFVDFSIHRRKMEQILLVDSLPKETVAVITMVYKNTKEKIRSSDEDTDYFNTRGNICSIPVYYIPRLRAPNVNRFNERKWLYAGKGQKRAMLRTN